MVAPGSLARVQGWMVRSVGEKNLQARAADKSSATPQAMLARSRSRRIKRCVMRRARCKGGLTAVSVAAAARHETDGNPSCQQHGVGFGLGYCGDLDIVESNIAAIAGKYH